MVEYKNILLPIDFSECSAVLAPYAIDMCRRYGAKLHVLFVARTMRRFVGFGPHPSLDKIDEDIAHAAERKMKGYCKDNLQDIANYSTQVVIGDPSEEILKFTEKENIDLVVMGTHGRKGLDRTIFGSVAEGVVRGAACPVLTINPHKVPSKKHN